MPWSNAVDTLIEETMSNICDENKDGKISQSIPRHASELREQCRLMSLRRMLLKYGISKFNLSDLGQAKSK